MSLCYHYWLLCDPDPARPAQGAVKPAQLRWPSGVYLLVTNKNFYFLYEVGRYWVNRACAELTWQAYEALTRCHVNYCLKLCYHHETIITSDSILPSKTLPSTPNQKLVPSRSRTATSNHLIHLFDTCELYQIQMCTVFLKPELLRRQRYKICSQPYSSYITPQVTPNIKIPSTSTKSLLCKSQTQD